MDEIPQTRVFENFYSSPNIFRMKNPVTWAGHVARIVEEDRGTEELWEGNLRARDFLLPLHKVLSVFCLTVHCTPLTVHCTTLTVHCTPLAVHCTSLRVHCTPLTVHCTHLQCTLSYLQCTVPHLQCTAPTYSALHPTYSALYPTYSAL